MIKQARFKTLFFFLNLVLFCRAFSSGWVQEKGKHFLEVSHGRYTSNYLFDSGGGKIRNFVNIVPGNVLSGQNDSEYHQNDVNVYLEYGIGFDLQIQGSFPVYVWSSQNTSNGQYEVSGPSDILIGAKYNWMNLPKLVSSIDFMLSIPIGDEKALSNRVGTFLAQRIPLGDGEYDLLTRLNFSRAFVQVPVYTTLSFGYRFRDINNESNFGNDIYFGLDGGYTLNLRNENSWFNSMILTFATRGFYNPKNVDTGNDASLVVTGNIGGQSFVEIQPGVIFKIWKNLGFNFIYSNVVWGVNTADGWSIRSGFSWGS